jgi:hypothetical protein
MTKYGNPFKPGAGHYTPYLAGRTLETEEFENLLEQRVILQNLIISGLRGVGKTVLLQSFRPIAVKKGWLWAGQDCTEGTSIDENSMVIRLLTDIALVTSSVKVRAEKDIAPIGFSKEDRVLEQSLDFQYLVGLYTRLPGVANDKLKALLSFVWECLKPLSVNGVVFAYDEAQSLSDHPDEKQFPLGLLLDVFQFLQKTGVPFMLVLTGLPTLQAKLVEAKTYTERMFTVQILDRLSLEASKKAIIIPIKESKHPLMFSDAAIDLIVGKSEGYPYFIQYICREAYDILEQHLVEGSTPTFPIDDIIRKLDNDFFAGRWAQATERQRELLTLVAKAGKKEFTITEVVDLSIKAEETKSFSSSLVNQMFKTLISESLLYKNRRGSYSFAVPLLDQYVLRFNEFKNLIS